MIQVLGHSIRANMQSDYTTSITRPWSWRVYRCTVHYVAPLAQEHTVWVQTEHLSDVWNRRSHALSDIERVIEFLACREACSWYHCCLHITESSWFGAGMTTVGHPASGIPDWVLWGRFLASESRYHLTVVFQKRESRSTRPGLWGLDCVCVVSWVDPHGTLSRPQNVVFHQVVSFSV